MSILILALAIAAFAGTLGFIGAKLETRRIARLTASMQADAIRAAFYRAATRPVRY